MSNPNYRDTQEKIQELTLVLSSKPDYWEDLLYPLNLAPKLERGRASLWITSTLSQWMTKRYFELKVFVQLNIQQNDENGEGLYLVSALNSSRFITFVEHLFYNMPYEHAEVAMQLQNRPAFQVKNDETYLIKGRVSDQEDKYRDHEVYSEKQQWTGPIYLPNQDQGLKTDRRMYRVHYEGYTKVVPFSEKVDTFELSEDGKHPISDHLIAAGYRPEYWLIRPEATHRKTGLSNLKD